MSKERNNGRIRGWLALAGWAAVVITLVVLILSTGITWGEQRATLDNHETRIKKVEDAQTEIVEIKMEVVRIRTILEQKPQRKETGP